MPWGVISQEEVDSWKNTAVEILEPYKDKIEVLEMYSTDAVNLIPDNSLDYIFIDGDHSYEAVLRDVRAYWSKVKVGGLFTGHDWILDNVKQAVTEFREENNIKSDMKFADFHVWFWYKQ
jgi:predicted O-methyltransferase YrrM